MRAGLLTSRKRSARARVAVMESSPQPVFFFQAEDGIRDLTVTGVQTCALPISHFGLGLTMHRGTPFADDVELREEGVVRIYDIFFDYEVLLSTDAYIRDVSAGPEFQRPMSTAEYHYLLGGYILEREKALGISRKSVLGVAHQCALPIYTSSPGDSSIGMNVAEQALTGSQLRFDPSADVNETSAIVFDAKTHGGKSGILIIGGGSPKNRM